MYIKTLKLSVRLYIRSHVSEIIIFLSVYIIPKESLINYFEFKTESNEI
jgi:hypothetical protein